MIVDSSVIIAIVLEEPEQEMFNAILAQSNDSKLSAGSWIELAAVMTNRAAILAPTIDRLMAHFQIEIAAVTADQARIGHEAYRRYGRGSGHPARLNFGDCFAYALSRATGEPLLFKGDDFSQTDIVAA